MLMLFAAAAWLQRCWVKSLKIKFYFLTNSANARLAKQRMPSGGNAKGNHLPKLGMVRFSRFCSLIRNNSEMEKDSGEKHDKREIGNDFGNARK